MKRVVSTDEAPDAVGAYSQATSNDSLVFTAGQIPLTPDGDLLADENVTRQTEQALDNVMAVLRAEGATAEDVLKVTLFLADIEDFDAVNDAYATYFEIDPPARSAVAVADLPGGVAVEIEAVASLE
jgi:reactive intermediate/imine deaminase